MQFAFTVEQNLIAGTVGSFFAGQATSDATRAAMETVIGMDGELWKGFGQELGLAGLSIPQAYGGSEMGMIELAIVAEAAGRHLAALPLIASLGLATPTLLAGGSDQQRDLWLPQLAGGLSIGTLAFETSLAIDGNALSGEALFVPHGAAADLFLLVARETLVLIERDTPGLSILPETTLDQTRPFARLMLENVSAEFLPLPHEGRAAALQTGYITVAADALGGAQACLDRTVQFVQERVQFGRVIGSFQAVKHKLADMMVAIEQARSAVYWAACATDEGDSEAGLAAHCAKASAAETYQMCAGAMIQLHGGIGFTWEHDAHLYFKRARANATLLGTPAWHREQIARAIGLDEAA